MTAAWLESLTDYLEPVYTPKVRQISRDTIMTKYQKNWKKILKSEIVFELKGNEYKYNNYSEAEKIAHINCYPKLSIPERLRKKYYKL